jgi:hypothetical protein
MKEKGGRLSQTETEPKEDDTAKKGKKTNI